MKKDNKQDPVTRVRKSGRSYPFSRGILSKSISRTGLSLDKVKDVVKEVQKELAKQDKDEVETELIEELVSKHLLDKGFNVEERYYRITRRLKHLNKPLLIIIGGGAGVGKSTIAAEISHRLGIRRSVGSDGIREVIRFMVPSDFIPVLHESSFKAGEKLRLPVVEDNVIYGFTEQVDLVNSGVSAFIRRGVKEGLDTILNGVHLVPGYTRIDYDSVYCFHYVLHLTEEERHIQHIYLRSENSFRNPEKYVKDLDNIRRIQQFIIEQAEKEGVRVIDNYDFNRTLRIILDDIMSKLEEKCYNDKGKMEEEC